jgi:hypothetical protein
MATLNAQMLKPRTPPRADTTDDESEEESTDDESDEEVEEEDERAAADEAVEAISFCNGKLQLENVTAEDVFTLLHAGWTLTASAPIPGTYKVKPKAPPQSAPPPPSRPSTSAVAPKPMKRSTLTKSIKRVKSKTKSLLATIKSAAKGKAKSKGEKARKGQLQAPDQAESGPEPLPTVHEDPEGEQQATTSAAVPRRRATTSANSARRPPTELTEQAPPSLPFSPKSWMLHKAALKRKHGKRARDDEANVPPTPSSARSLMVKRLRNHMTDPPGANYPPPGSPRYRPTPKRLGEQYDRMKL